MEKKNLKDIILKCLTLLLALIFVCSVLYLAEPLLKAERKDIEVTASTKTIVRDGKSYFPRQDITVIMVLGIDKYGVRAPANNYRNEGAADSIMLLIFDEKEKTCDVLCLNRDTMVNMDVLGLKGELAGTSYGQLALAHTYGDGMEESSQNVKNTLQKFIHGLSIDYCVSMNMDAIPIANDAVGGVKVTVKEDFSKVNPTIKMGEITLKGDQVIDYVRTRKDVGNQKNLTRMERQQEYVKGFISALKEKSSKDLNFALSLYDSVAPYIVTDLTPSNINSMLQRYSSFNLGEFFTYEGENIIKDGYYQFIVDEEKFDALTVKLFYSEK